MADYPLDIATSANLKVSFDWKFELDVSSSVVEALTSVTMGGFHLQDLVSSGMEAYASGIEADTFGIEAYTSGIEADTSGIEADTF